MIGCDKAVRTEKKNPAPPFEPAPLGIELNKVQRQSLFTYTNSLSILDFTHCCAGFSQLIRLCHAAGR